jgi:hypothetical protein
MLIRVKGRTVKFAFLMLLSSVVSSFAAGAASGQEGSYNNNTRNQRDVESNAQMRITDQGKGQPDVDEMRRASGARRPEKTSDPYNFEDSGPRLRRIPER